MRYGFTCLLVIVAFGASHSQAGLIVNPTFNDAQFSADGYSAGQITQIHSAFNFAAGEFQSKFDDNVHVNINVTSGNVGLGQSTTQLVGFLNYASVKTALAADATTPNDATAVANLAATDPTGSNKFLVSRAEAKALGLIADDLTSDGTYTFSKSQPYTFDPLNRGAAGKFDFIGIAEHEISEIMGRIYTLGTLSGAYMINDLFRYTAPGVQSVSTSAVGAYFSINKGATNLVGFNSNPAGDLQDYSGANSTDPFNAFTGTGQAHALNTVDFQNLDVIGYNLHQNPAAVPEPASLVLFAIGLAGFAGTKRRRVVIVAVGQK